MTTPSKGGAEKPAPMTATALQKEARGMSMLALETLAAIMRGDGQDSAKLAAAREVLDRAHGKPKPAPKPRSKPPEPKAAGGHDGDRQALWRRDGAGRGRA